MKLPDTKLISLHVPAALLERVEALQAIVEEIGEARTSRASVLRRAIGIGVKSMERKVQRDNKGVSDGQGT